MDWRDVVRPEVLASLNPYDARTLDGFQWAVSLEAVPEFSQFKDNDDLMAGWLVYLFIKGFANRNHLNYFRRILDLKSLIPKVGVCVATTAVG